MSSAIGVDAGAMNAAPGTPSISAPVVEALFVSVRRVVLTATAPHTPTAATVGFARTLRGCTAKTFAVAAQPLLRPR